MKYLENSLEKRLNPKKLFPSLESIICCLLPYSPPEKNSTHPIAAFALRKDYHKILHKRLVKLAEKIKAKIEDFEYKVFCDSAPVLEKALAAKSGLGWFGKNNLLLNAEYGSYFFLGEIFTNLPLPIDEPIANRCGSCNKCIFACKTKALTNPRQLNANRCIAYLTIENKEIIPQELQALMENKIFGCDDCQKVCPWNRFAKAIPDPELQPFSHLKNIDLKDAQNWDENTFINKTTESPICRIGWQRWQRNIEIALKNL
jgi:epoxyqueuosine reductase